METAFAETGATLAILFAGMPVTKIITHFELSSSNQARRTTKRMTKRIKRAKNKRTRRTREAWCWAKTRRTGARERAKHCPRHLQLY